MSPNIFTMLFRLITAVCLFILINIPATMQVQAQTLRSSIPGDSLEAGEVFHISLVLQTEREYTDINFPDTTHFPTDLLVLERQQYKVSDFTDSLSYRLQFFGTENIPLNPLPVQLISDSDTTMLFTEPSVLFFRTLLEADTSQTAFKPAKPNFEFPRPLWPWLLAVGLLIAAALWWFYFRKKEEEPEQEVQAAPPAVFVDPLDELERRLQQIRNNRQPEKSGDFKGFYSETGDAVRAYYERVYQIPALESTTGELSRMLDSRGIDHELINHSRYILNRADMVKFAKFTPTADEAWLTFRRAEDFLQRARAVDEAKVRRLRLQFEEALRKAQQEDAESGSDSASRRDEKTAESEVKEGEQSASENKKGGS